MKKIMTLIFIWLCAAGIVGCSPSKIEPCIVNTYEETSADLMEEYLESSKIITTVTYYEMSDGTWKTDSHTYQYKLELTGRMHAAAKDSTYIILSNTDDITFDQAWKASGLSSNLDDYFKEEDAVIVGIG
ncbi:MAG: immunogenic protein [Lachnospiraceae bacterium]|nr:immunogenic protein [Lachnospiraceae bacterium]